MNLVNDEAIKQFKKLLIDLIYLEDFINFGSK